VQNATLDGQYNRNHIVLTGPVIGDILIAGLFILQVELVNLMSTIMTFNAILVI